MKKKWSHTSASPALRLTSNIYTSVIPSYSTTPWTWQPPHTLVKVVSGLRDRTAVRTSLTIGLRSPIDSVFPRLIHLEEVFRGWTSFSASPTEINEGVVREFFLKLGSRGLPVRTPLQYPQNYRFTLLTLVTIDKPMRKETRQYPAANISRLYGFALRYWGKMSHIVVTNDSTPTNYKWIKHCFSQTNGLGCYNKWNTWEDNSLRGFVVQWVPWLCKGSPLPLTIC